MRERTKITASGPVVYLPDGSIVFASTREIKYVPCDTQIVPHMFRMRGDGSAIHQLTRSTAHENQLSLLPDGRILYSRWDYVDRNFGDGHGFWVVNPDGTNPALIWGNNTTHPSTGWFARSIPGTGRLLCILGTHHGSLGGSLAILDPHEAIEGKESVVRTWPAEVKGRFERGGDPRLEREGNISVRLAVEGWSPETRRLWSADANMRMHRHDDNLENVRPWYNTPWPLSEKYFLCARADSRKDRTALCLVDVFGNELLLHTEERGCYSPMPLAPRPKLDRESLDRLMTWVDINGPYYPTTYCAYPHNPPGRCSLNRRELETLGRLTGFTIEQVIRSSDCKGPMISFDRPALSPCLSGLEGTPARYAEALSIIGEGQRRLKERPRADMPGFVPWERDLERQAHREKYLTIERETRKAMRERRD